ncbi:ABC-F family ATP-binding cassette domain-containing protein [Streptomyces sp. NBC_00272]|uniref:ABC-F family ATP-binding cassette domain-containing protein n=1 Tax=Streptomyces sp. NBC_00272 TaxID=2975698 RepID=UPI002E28ADA1|nr:ABC-F family ATP-binding cassette domain-containing protein [Streptomyces sp. NBC_00272]
MTAQLSALDVTKSYNGRLVLESVTCSVPAGGRLGVVGENGSGKSTLLRLFAGLEVPDRGEVFAHADGGIGHLAQEEQLPAHHTVQRILDRALSELHAMERRMRLLEAAMADGIEHGAGREAGRPTVLAEYADLLAAYELRGGYDADARVERTLNGLGLVKLPRDRTVGRLSGGERVRLRLASLLVAAPEVLLLDEPTNHLDDNALSWLEDHLRGRAGTTVAVSHDRVFLDRVTTALWEVDADRHLVTRYGNGYAGYLAARTAERQRRADAHAAWRAEVARLRETASVTARRVAPGRVMKDGNKMAYDRAAGRVQSSLASRVRNARERLDRLLAHPVPAPAEPLRFSPTLRGAGARGLLLHAAGVAVAGRLAPVGLSLSAGDRILITGANGVGKTTLLDVLAGTAVPDRGHVVRPGGVRTVYLPQLPEPGPAGHSALAAFGRGRAGSAEEHAERLLALGLLDRSCLEVRIADLSAGQRQRLALARTVCEPADVLLLDEPTNHLSPALIEELEAALAGFPGAVVLVSHDRRLRSRWRGRQLALHAPAHAPAPAHGHAHASAAPAAA